MLFKVLQKNCHFNRLPISFVRQFTSNLGDAPTKENSDEFKNWKEKLYSTMTIHENFISEEEETSLLSEIEPYMKGLRYEYDHWDNAIHGFRETEFPKWNEENTKIIDKVRKRAFPPDMPQIKFVHVLDLAENGWIKPHIDSTRFCGEVIATISLLSDCIMRLTYDGHEQDYWSDFLIPRRSLYIMKGVARYKYKHEVLSKEKSIFEGKDINKIRRISVICRSEAD